MFSDLLASRLQNSGRDRNVVDILPLTAEEKWIISDNLHLDLDELAERLGRPKTDIAIYLHQYQRELDARFENLSVISVENWYQKRMLVKRKS